MENKQPDLRVDLIARENIPLIFPLVQSQLKRAVELSSQEYPMESIIQRLLSGHAQLWICAEKERTLLLTAVTRVVPYPGVRRFAIDILVGAKLEEVYPFLRVLEEWAWSKGCTETESYCRPGMAKKLQAKGWTKAYEVMIKPIQVE